jgi:prepilin-type N-terminal cleavage/methylation domain-containing protein
MIYKNNKIENGFTIVELVMAIFILGFAVVGVYNAFSVAVVLTTGTYDRFTAAYLAEEGIEVVRNIRDTNWLNNKIWMEGLHGDGVTDCTQGCEAAYTTMGTNASLLIPWVATSEPPGRYLYIKNDGFYSYETTNATPTKFRRKITITQKPLSVINVSVKVFWLEKSNILNTSIQDRSIEVEEDLYNWY